MRNSSGELTKLEHDALYLALSRRTDGVRALVETVPLLRVVKRERTGVGFFTKFLPDDRLRRIDIDEKKVSRAPPSIYAFHPAIAGCADFLVWIDNGQIDCLEAAATSAWPTDEAGFVFEEDRDANP